MTSVSDPIAMRPSNPYQEMMPSQEMCNINFPKINKSLMELQSYASKLPDQGSGSPAEIKDPVLRQK